MTYFVKLTSLQAICLRNFKRTKNFCFFHKTFEKRLFSESFNICEKESIHFKLTRHSESESAKLHKKKPSQLYQIKHISICTRVDDLSLPDVI